MRIKILILLLNLFLIDSSIIADNIKESVGDSIIERYNISSVDYILDLSREKKIHDFDSTESILLTANHLADSLTETENQIDALILLSQLYYDNAYFGKAEDVLKRILRD